MRISVPVAATVMPPFPSLPTGEDAARPADWHSTLVAFCPLASARKGGITAAPTGARLRVWSALRYQGRVRLQTRSSCAYDYTYDAMVFVLYAAHLAGLQRLSTEDRDDCRALFPKWAKTASCKPQYRFNINELLIYPTERSIRCYFRARSTGDNDDSWASQFVAEISLRLKEQRLPLMMQPKRLGKISKLALKSHREYVEAMELNSSN